MFGRKKDSQKSEKSIKWKKLEELVLPNAKLRFCPEQLQNLNFLFSKRLQQTAAIGTEKSLLLAKSVTERLVQRLLCGAGMVDSRFASKYLICNNNQQTNDTSTKLEYMVRLDCLSTPKIYDADSTLKYSVIETDSDYPAAYARIRLHPSSFKEWGDYINSNGFLRRDKVQTRLVELLAVAASKDVPNSPLHIDESIYCGIPGKVVDTFTLYSILKIPTHQHIYYGPGGNIPRFPDPRDFRLAIVDEPDGIRLRVEFLSPALSNYSMDVRILVVIGIDAWPSSTDFPSRISLGHSDCLMYHQAAQTGMFLVGYGVQSSAWQIRLSAAECVLLNHYSSNSTVRTVLDILYTVLDDIKTSRNLGKHQLSYKILNRYIFQTLLLVELEENSKSPLLDMIYWSPTYLSTHVLRLLDKIISKLREEILPNYFFKESNLLVNPGHLSDDDYIIEANNIKAVMVRFFDESLVPINVLGNEDFSKMILNQDGEITLLYKWKELINGLLPPPGTRGRRFCFSETKHKLEVAHTQYTSKQLEYIGLLLNKMLIVKQNILQADQTIIEVPMKSDEFENEHPLEDVIFILVSIMDQARDIYLATQTNPTILKNKLKIKSMYNTYTSKLIEIMRKDKELLNINFDNNLVLVKVILKWLYKAMDQNKKCLGAILRPYLNNLFVTSHSISWHIDSIKSRSDNTEIKMLRCFSEMVNSSKIKPAQGLIDNVKQNMSWAKSMLNMVEKNTLRVVFITGRGMVFRHVISLPSYQNKDIESGSKTLGATRENKEIKRHITLPNRCYFNTILNKGANEMSNETVPQHDILRIASPLSYIFNKMHRRGDHRGGGDIFEALKSMQKLNMFQEVASNLSPEDRLQLTEIVNSFQTMKARRDQAKRWSGTLSQLNTKKRVNPKCEPIQKYTPKEESAGIRIQDIVKDKKLKIKNMDSTSLIGSCRAARIREDSSVFLVHDNFKVKSLLNKTESFKY